MVPLIAPLLITSPALSTISSVVYLAFLSHMISIASFKVPDLLGLTTSTIFTLSRCIWGSIKEGTVSLPCASISCSAFSEMFYL